MIQIKIIFILLIAGTLAEEGEEPAYNYTLYNTKRVNEKISGTLIIQQEEDASALSYYVRNRGYETNIYTINGSIIYKSGKSNNLEKTLSLCFNSAILASEYSVNFENSILNTTDSGSIALCAVDGGKITARNSTIITHSANSNALRAKSGSVSAYHSKIQTLGENSPILSDEIGSHVYCDDCELYTAKTGSPLVNTKGSCTLTRTNGYAENSQAMIIDGKINVQIQGGSKLKCSGKGTSADSSDACGIWIKNSTAGNGHQVGTSQNYTSLYIFNASLEITDETAPMILVDGAYSSFSFSYASIKSKIFLKIKGTSSPINLFMNGCDIKGDIIGDENTHLSISLQKSNFTGAINPDGKAGYINFFMSESSTLTLTGNSNFDEYYNADQTKSNVITNSFSMNGVEEDSSLSILCSKLMLLLLVCLLV